MMDRPMYYDKHGKPLKLMEWAKLLENFDYKVIKQEFTPDNKYWVSTVWLGLDHGFGNGAPLIFETMVFENKWRWTKPDKLFNMKPFKYREEQDVERYSTLIAAIHGHEELVKKWTKNP